MKTILAKSYRMTRYHAVIAIIITTIISWVLLRYSLILQADVERFAFNNNLRVIIYMLNTQKRISNNTFFCADLARPDRFQHFIGIKLQPRQLANGESRLGKWHYNPKKLLLTYFVKSEEFFKSKFGKVIQIQFFCDDSGLIYEVSPHDWCKEKGILGCKHW